MKIRMTFLLIFAFLNVLSGQELSQAVRGQIIDEDTRVPLLGATIVLTTKSESVGMITDENGYFRFEEVPLGRISLRISYVGYKDKVMTDLSLNSAKELVLDIEMTEEAFVAEEVVIKGIQTKGDPLNEMALISARSISTEQSSRYAGGFNDPSRITSNFAGVTNTQDGGNDIIVRGNSPKYIQWRLEGAQISNPNHFADHNQVSGVLSALNNNLVSTSDFYTGAFSADYGGALSGVYDVRMRKGNNDKFEGMASLGLLGTDVTIEGPFSKNSKASYLFNYRYSTIGLVTDIGLVDLDGLLKFQDSSFKIWLPTNKLGSFSFFGLAGKSRFAFEDVDPSFWVTPGDNFMREDITEDYNKDSHLLHVGLNHILPINENGYLKNSLIYSNEGIGDEVLENITLRDSSKVNRMNFDNDLSISSMRFSSVYNHKVNARHKLRVGVNYNILGYDMDQGRLEDEMRIPILNFDESIDQLGTFVNWKFHVSPSLTMLAGIHNNNVLYNNDHTIEPRLSFSYQLNSANRLSLGYGNHSTMESVPHYFTKIRTPDGYFETPNNDLGLLKAHHLVLGYEHNFTEYLKLKVEAYYQDLYDIPVENDINSSYSTINEGLEFQYVDLVNEGKGKNYGLELTFEQYLKNGYYFLINGTLYESKYTSLDGLERNTQYNGHYLANVLFGKEWEGLGKKGNQVFSFSTRLFYGGGKNILSLRRDEQGQLAVNPELGEYYDLENAYAERLEDTHNIVVNLGYKWNRSSTAHELYLSLDNVTNKQSKLLEYYDTSEPNGIGYQTQVGFYPNLLYRFYF